MFNTNPLFMPLSKRLYLQNAGLVKIPFNFLLSYHSPVGNTTKFWSHHLMISHILGIRNDVNILHLGYTLIQIRKALNVVFNTAMSRRSLLIYAQAKNNFRLESRAIFTFVNAWLPGLLTNYKQSIKSIHLNKLKLFRSGRLYLRRPQVEAANTIQYRRRLFPTFIKRKLLARTRTRTRLPGIPNISLSLLDSKVWLNECFTLQIPSIQVCDTQSPYDKITYPIVANQKSMPFTYLIIGLFIEACAFAFMTEQLFAARQKLNPNKLGHLDVKNVRVKHNLTPKYLKAIRLLKKSRHLFTQGFNSLHDFVILNNKSYRKPFFRAGFTFQQKKKS